MANTKYQYFTYPSLSGRYVKHFEQDEKILLNTYFVVRIDGKGFHKSSSSKNVLMRRFSEAHQFEKPNDIRALELMNRVLLTIYTVISR